MKALKELQLREDTSWPNSRKHTRSSSTSTGDRLFKRLRLNPPKRVPASRNLHTDEHLEAANEAPTRVRVSDEARKGFTRAIHWDGHHDSHGSDEDTYAMEQWPIGQLRDVARSTMSGLVGWYSIRYSKCQLPAPVPVLQMKGMDSLMQYLTETKSLKQLVLQVLHNAAGIKGCFFYRLNLIALAAWKRGKIKEKIHTTEIINELIDVERQLKRVGRVDRYSLPLGQNCWSELLLAGERWGRVLENFNLSVLLVRSYPLGFGRYVEGIAQLPDITFSLFAIMLTGTNSVIAWMTKSEFSEALSRLVRNHSLVGLTEALIPTLHKMLEDGTEADISKLTERITSKFPNLDAPI